MPTATTPTKAAETIETFLSCRWGEQFTPAECGHARQLLLSAAQMIRSLSAPPEKANDRQLAGEMAAYADMYASLRDSHPGAAILLREGAAALRGETPAAAESTAHPLCSAEVDEAYRGAFAEPRTVEGEPSDEDLEIAAACMAFEDMAGRQPTPAELRQMMAINRPLVRDGLDEACEAAFSRPLVAEACVDLAGASLDYALRN